MKAYWGYNETVSDFENTLADGHQPKIVERDLLDFFADRLKVHLRERGVRHDHVEAVFALGGEDDLVRLLARVDALSGFLATDDGENLLAAYKRASNIVAIEEKKDGTTFEGEIAGGSSFAGRGACPCRRADGVRRKRKQRCCGRKNTSPPWRQWRTCASLSICSSTRSPSMPTMPIYERTGCGCCPNSVPRSAGSPIFPE